MPKPTTWNLVWLITSKMRYLSYISVLLVCWACQKAPERSCWKGTGPIEITQLPLDSFSFLHVHPHMEVVLVQDSLNYVEWQAGQNLKSFLSATIENDTLQLHNHNRCGFLRYRNGDVKVVVHFKTLKELHLDNSEAVSTYTKWTQDDVLIFLKEGVGKVVLALNAQKATVRNNYGWQNLRLSGTVGALFVDLDGSAALEAPALQVQDSISFRSESPLSSWLRADQILLKAQLYGAGNLYYSKTPSTLLKTEYSTGKVLPK
jgi:hypothetical protein